MYDYLIIGGGIIGLNIAKTLKERYPVKNILLLEKEDDVAKHSSGRNSGVLHAGFYYTKNSLKAKFTKDGNLAMKEFCRKRNIAINECGKVVVASNEEEYQSLYELKKRADANEVNLEFISQEELKEKFPDIKTYKKALYSPDTASINPKEVSLEFKKYILELGVEIVFSCKYEKKLSQNIIKTSKGEFKFSKLINCAGLYADKIAKDFNLCEEYVIIPFKGVYLKDEQNKQNLKTNIYPVPNLNNPFWGVHYTLSSDNVSKIGPTAIPAFWRENYNGFDNFKLDEFLQIIYYEAKLFITNSFGFRNLAFDEIKKYNKNYLRNLALKMINHKTNDTHDKWSTPGIRAQLLHKKTLNLEQDFVVQKENNTIHILNSVSPAFTCSIPFSAWVIENYIEN